ncbi:MAG: hypothetical protein A3B68_07340 [Candidatus Melainabacteria bacterium RIFCSPHIGHO2_02_FULL_34_12]|nr:MAG: hypothetical protein A3B68_07340 [Candidatus Melainabacteria bacterium RIFCSPHIGHO2_02_FULL_34_12]
MNSKKFKFVLLSIILASLCMPALADNNQPLNGQVSDPYVEAQEKLTFAKGSYKTVKQQEDAIKNMKTATKLSLRAAKLRTKAEKLQTKADILVNKASQTAISRGLYITNPMAPVMMQPPPQQQTVKAPSFVPVPGQAINIIVPKQEEVSLGQDQNQNYLPPPGVSDF